MAAGRVGSRPRLVPRGAKEIHVPGRSFLCLLQRRASRFRARRNIAVDGSVGAQQAGTVTSDRQSAGGSSQARSGDEPQVQRSRLRPCLCAALRLGRQQLAIRSRCKRDHGCYIAECNRVHSAGQQRLLDVHAALPLYPGIREHFCHGHYR